MKIEKSARSRCRSLLLAAAVGSLAMVGAAGAQDKNKEVQVGMTPKFLKDDFQTLMVELSRKAFEAKGFNIIGVPDPNGDVAAQVDALQNLVANGANVIVFAPNDAAGIVPAVKRANEAGALVFSIDDAPAGGNVTATVRADNVDAGVQGAQEMAKRLKDKACWAAKTCVVLELQGSLAAPNGLDRSDGFSKTLKELAPDVTNIQRPTEWTVDMTADATQNVLTQNPELAGVFMASELMVSAVNAQLKRIGRDAKVGDAESVVRVAIDGTPQGLQSIRDKVLDATVSQPLGAYASKTADLIELVFNGGKIELGDKPDGRVIETPVGPQYQLKATLVTLDNVESPDLWANQLGK